MQTLLDYLNNPVGTANIAGLSSTIKVYENNTRYFCSFMPTNDMMDIFIRLKIPTAFITYNLNGYFIKASKTYKITWNKEPLMLLHIKETK